MKNEICNVSKENYVEIVELWEASVRATHHFLKEEDILYFKPLILNEYLDAVELRCIKNNNQQIVGFSGIHENSLEMLFIHPDYRGQKIGKKLLTYAFENFSVHKVDVNEQNEQAIGFYQHYGFKTISRSELDGTGKPYPILHMELVKS
ncbi:GNAT family N-acetyltransferase [Tenacibaculum sp. TC6]|uniref:GNAT family N-acetyltransferase n=1 Tax=Tenacibaculum sp. TC6 TaxID=3423223 RepID=UPI003D368F0A